MDPALFTLQGDQPGLETLLRDQASIAAQHEKQRLWGTVLAEDIDTVQALLDTGADVNARDERGSTPLMRAAGGSDDPEVVRLLLDAGANLTARDEHGLTPLMFAAARNQNSAVVLALLDAGANLEASAEGGIKPLMAAARWNENPEVLQALLDAGADAKATDQWQRRAIDYARENEHLQGTDAYWRLNDASFD